MNEEDSSRKDAKTRIGSECGKAAFLIRTFEVP
jgi:hypothetical protein